jgi:activator of HSP90 ATPase
MTTTTINQTIFFPGVKPVQIYDAYLDPRKHSEFTGAEASCDPMVGGAFSAWDGYITGRILELSKARRILQEWKTTEWPEGYPPSILELTFRAMDEGTEVMMVHSNVPSQQVDSYQQGWIDYYWNPLKEYFGIKMK